MKYQLDKFGYDTDIFKEFTIDVTGIDRAELVKRFGITQSRKLAESLTRVR